MAIIDKQEWEKIRAGGMGRFLFLNGVVGRGLPMALVCALAIEIYLGGELPEALVSPGFLGRLGLALAVFSLSGVMNARMKWNYYERRHSLER